MVAVITRTGQGRPKPGIWVAEIKSLSDRFERETWLSREAYEAAAIRIGVSEQTVRTRFAEHRRRLAHGCRASLAKVDVGAVADAADFPNAIARLRTLGRTEPTVSLEDALWRAPGIELIALRRREQSRRQSNNVHAGQAEG